MSMSIPYELNGRIHQKRRTRDALVAAARELVASGETPTVEAAAEAASISRTTAYRYFPNQRALLVAAHPETGAISLLPDTIPRRRAGSTRPRHRPIHALERRERGATTHDAATLARSRPGRARRNCHCGKVGRSNGSKKRSRRSAPRCPTPTSTASPSRYEARPGSKRFAWLTDVAGLSRHDATEAHAVVRPRDAAVGDGRRQPTRATEQT